MAIQNLNTNDPTLQAAIVQHLRSKCEGGLEAFCSWTAEAILKGNRMDTLYLDLFGPVIGRDMTKVYRELRKE